MKISKIYHSIKLNLGVKTFLKKTIDKIDLLVSNKLLMPLLKLLNTLVYKKIIYHYGGDYRTGDEKSQNINKKLNNYGYGSFHFCMIRNLKPQNILCVGSMHGFIPFMLAKACELNNKGRVDFVDAGFDMDDPKYEGKHYYGQGFWKKTNPKKHFSYFLNSRHIKTYVNTTAEFRKKHKCKYNYIYLDGDHSYKGMKKDFNMFWPLLKTGGYLIFHDIEYKIKADGLKFGVNKLWKELKEKYRSVEINNNYSGLGIIQKSIQK